MDQYIFNLINGLAGNWQFADYLAIFFAKYFEYFLLLILAVMFFSNWKKYWRMFAVSIPSAVISRFVIANIIRAIWFRSRPFIDHKVNLLLSNYPNEAAFPSGHASFYFALSTVIFLYNKKLGIFFFASSALIALSRVFVGIHWPSDILFGALLGILVGWLGYRVGNKYLK